MKIAVRYPGRLFTMVNQFSFMTPPVRVQDFAVRAGAKRKPGIACQIYENRGGRCDD